MNLSQTDLAHQIVSAHQTGQPKPIVDDELSLADAYKVQSDVVSQLGGTVVGFKAALSSKAAQSVFSVSEPVFGALLSNAEIQSGFDLSEMVAPMVEIEMGFELGASLTAPLSPLDFNQVFRSTVMAIDLAEVGFTGRPSGLDLVTSNAAGGRFLRGGEVVCNDPNAVSAELWLDGAMINSGLSGDIGDQRSLAVWLVNQALSLGYEVSSGMLIMTGAIGQILPAKPGRYEAKYGSAGSFSFELR